MDEYESRSHSKWECKCYVVFIPERRRKVLYGKLRRRSGEVLRKCAEEKERRIEEGHLMADHVDMMISIPPKHSMSSAVDFIKGNRAIHLARVYGKQNQDNAGKSLRARIFRVDVGPQ